MSQAAKTSEPSMEEILASIRKIIADDEQPKAAEKPAAKEPEPVADDAPQSQDDIDALFASFDAVEEEPAPPPPPPPKAKAAPPPPPPPEPEVIELTDPVDLPVMHNDVDFTDVEEPPPPPPPPRAKAPPAPPPPAPVAEAPLLSQNAARAVGAAFDSLGSLTLASGGTVDGLVRELLRPMLKQWLDENLPVLVESLVKAEIERARNGGR